MKKYNIERNIKFAVLSDEAIEQINKASLTIMEQLGMKISGERTLKLLHENGCYTDENGITRISRDLVRKALETVPKEVIIYDRNKNPHMILNSKNNLYFGTHADQLEILDIETDSVRPFLKKDTELMCKIAQNLKNIDFVLSVGLSSDVDPKVQSVISFIETLKYFEKPINFSTNDIDTIQEIIDIAALVAGGKEVLQEKPFIFNYCEPIPPLTHPAESTEKLYLSAINKIPVVYMPYCMMGGTAPMNMATTLAQCYSEILTGIVVTQLINPGAPFIIGAMPSIFDMKTSIGSYAAPEFHLMIAAASEMADYYNLPFYGTAACSDSKSLDAQAFAEVSMQVFSTFLSKANVVHDVGIMDHCNSVSPVMVVIADEIIEAAKHYARGIKVDDATLNLDLISRVGHGGHYLNEKETFKKFKQVWYPSLFSRRMKNPDQSEVHSIAKEWINKIMENHPGSTLDAAILEKLDEIQQKYMDSVK
ncbi:trimethylamine methyltransferase family protein [Geosporobacter ferrireducens]|uniref:trimethylamine methyltransferase family protein n=1 Tax=Geosporobacter ferrireducens TaxID=1424294 RepID=UPI00139D1F24|nr:trimethylamine methyltransferase family protein [Geosporobacter ferrireducens]MTI54877.1 trimethylamine methyltransferase [Geosporobacter ferrireducens]